MYHVEFGDLNGNNKVLYYPTDEKCVALEPVLKRKVGDCGEFNIKIPVSNVLYSQISELKIITIYRNNKEKWRGYIKEITTSFNKTLNLYCIEDMGWLNYEFLTPESKKVRRDVQLQALINAYNNQNGIAGTAKVFEVGTVSSGASTEITYETTYEDSILDCLRIVAGSDRYVKVRRENGKRYIDIASLATYGKRSSQSIELGSNMLDYVKELNTGYMLNVIYPYGDEEEGKELYSGVMSRLKGTPLVNNESIAKYGRIAKNIIFSTSDLNTLNENASAYLNSNKDPRLSMDLTAVDMADLGVDTDDFELGDEIHTLATPFGIDQYIYITEQSINIQSVTKNKYKLSSTVSSNGLASQTATISAELQKIPTKASILETALSNAVNLLSAAKGGYVAYKFNDAGQPTEISIQNSLNNNQVTKKWVWNENGFGYMYKENSEWKTNVAITMDGSIVADYITSGTVEADRIKSSVISAINGQNLKIEAKNLDINGAVTFSDFNQETQQKIDGKADSSTLDDYTTKKDLKDGNTIIKGQCISTGAIISNNYKHTSGSFTDEGMFISLTNGNMYTPSFSFFSEQKKAYFKGDISASTMSSSTIKSSVLESSNYKRTTTDYYSEQGISIDLDNANIITPTFAVWKNHGTHIKGNLDSGSIGGLEIYNLSDNQHGFQYNQNNYFFRVGTKDITCGCAYGSGWCRLDWIPEWGMLRVDYGDANSSSKGIVVTNVGNNNKADNGSNYIQIKNTQIYRHRSDWGISYPVWTGNDDTSDINAKINVTDIPKEDVKYIYEHLRPIHFNYKEELDIRGEHFGVIAQDMEKILSDLGYTENVIVDHTEEDRYMRLHYYETIGLQIAGIKYLYEEVDALKEEIEALKQEIKSLKGDK